ncbi:MAG TPA: hypothetical protein PKA05_04200 [Roseiflexaceae bacterium]|nr:hypothetical protein [Roseiflexaceae bacterium]HMP39561.1 hypothetical protein [Roseiflexaceae bacterium]
MHTTHTTSTRRSTIGTSPTRMVFGEIDDTIRRALRVPQEAGYFEVICHTMATTHQLAPIRGGRPVACEPWHLVLCLLAHPGFHGQPIRLIACHAGTTTGVARHIANALQVKVIAPSGLIAPDGDCFTLVGGTWQVFLPEPCCVA